MAANPRDSPVFALKTDLSDVKIMIWMRLEDVQRLGFLVLAIPINTKPLVIFTSRCQWV